MKLAPLNKRIIVELFKASDGLFIFTLYQRFHSTPKELFVAIEELIASKLITKDASRIYLTSLGKEIIIENKIIIRGSRNKFGNFPENCLGRKIGINEFYLPSSKNIKDELQLNFLRDSTETSTN